MCFLLLYIEVYFYKIVVSFYTTVVGYRRQVSSHLTVSDNSGEQHGTN